jgi:hypothetical protein
MLQKAARLRTIGSDSYILSSSQAAIAGRGGRGGGGGGRGGLMVSRRKPRKDFPLVRWLTPLLFICRLQSRLEAAGVEVQGLSTIPESFRSQPYRLVGDTLCLMIE